MKSSKSYLPRKLLAVALSFALAVTWMIPSSLAVYAGDEPDPEAAADVSENVSSESEVTPAEENDAEATSDEETVTGDGQETEEEVTEEGDTEEGITEPEASEQENEEDIAEEGAEEVEAEPAGPATALPEAVNGTITLTQDVELADVAVITEPVNLDLAGHTITGTSSGRAIRVDSESLVLMDTSADKSGKIAVTGDNSRAIIANAPVVVSGGTIEVSGQDSVGIMVNNCTVMVRGADIIANGLGAMGVYDYGELKFRKGSIKAAGQGAIGIYMPGDDASAEVTGGSITVEGDGSGYGIEAIELGQTGNTVSVTGGSISVTGEKTYAVYLEMDNTLNISGGELTSRDATAIAFFQGGNTGTITGGTITGGETAYGVQLVSSASNSLSISGDPVISGGQGSINAGGNRYKSTPAVTITGGYFSGAVAGGVPSDKTDNYAKYDITGGYFTDKISDSALYNYALAKDYTPETYTDDVKAGEEYILTEANENKDGTVYNYKVVKPAYVLMNIPYADFYAAELGEGDAAVDAVTSATKNKPRTGTLAGGSYHKNADGTDISGVIYPVFVSDMSVLKNKKQITDEDSVEITVTNRGKENTTTYSGKDALFEAPDYSYYRLSDKPARSKTLTVSNDGTFSFSAVSGRATPVEGLTASVTAGARHADIEIKLSGTTGIDQGDAVSAVVLTDNDGNKYGLRHVVNVWRATEIGWNTADYDLAGKTITNVRYITQNDVLDFAVEIKVPSNEVVEAAKAKSAAEKAKTAADKAAEDVAAAKSAAEEAAKTPGDAAVEAAKNYEAAVATLAEAANAAKEAADTALEAAKKAYEADSDELKAAEEAAANAGQAVSDAKDAASDAKVGTANAERDAAKAAQTQAESERDAAKTAQTQAESEKGTAQSAQTKAEKERDAAKAAQTQAESERDAAKTAQTQAESEKGTAQSAQTKAEKERDAAKAAQTQAEKERDAAAAAKKKAEAERDKIKYTPARVKLTKAKAGKKKVTVTWKTIKKGVTGYQIQVINKKTGKVVKKVTVKQTKKIAKEKTVKKAVKKLKKGKYKVRVRAYCKKSGKTYYGKWEKVKSFKVK